MRAWYLTICSNMFWARVETFPNTSCFGYSGYWKLETFTSSIIYPIKMSPLFNFLLIKLTKLMSIMSICSAVVNITQSKIWSLWLFFSLWRYSGQVHAVGVATSSTPLASPPRLGLPTFFEIISGTNISKQALFNLHYIIHSLTNLVPVWLSLELMLWIWFHLLPLDWMKRVMFLIGCHSGHCGIIWQVMQKACVSIPEHSWFFNGIFDCMTPICLQTEVLQMYWVEFQADVVRHVT